MEEDGSVVEEEELFSELASNEFLLQQLRGLLDAGGQEMLDALPDGIHSGLVRSKAKGVFFYFQASPKKGETLNFWRYLDLHTGRVIDNRYEIANLIACERDTPRVVEPSMMDPVFALQEKVIEGILKSLHSQQALEAAPTTIDPVQQTVSTAIQSFLNRPDVDRQKGVELIRALNKPIPNVYIKALRTALKNFQGKGDALELMKAVSDVLGESSASSTADPASQLGARWRLDRADLRLICFDFISGG
jgi:hypothetical protein